MIFSRGGGSGGRHAAEEPRRSGRHSADRHDDQGEDFDDFDDDVASSAGAAQRPGGLMELDGPYDIEDAPEGLERVDLGSLQIPSVEGVEVRVQANADGVIQQVVLAHGESALQLGVFAAPRSEDIWDEVRDEIRKSLFDDGVAVEEVDGEYGIELRARVRTPEGLMDIRFIGVDGPRWMVRAVYQGKAAADPTAAGPLATCMRGLVVNRGREAMPVREALPLHLPREIADQARAQAEGAAATPPTNGATLPTNGATLPTNGVSVATNGVSVATNGVPAADGNGAGAVGNGAAPGVAAAHGAVHNGMIHEAVASNGAASNGAASNGSARNGSASNGAASNGAVADRSGGAGGAPAPRRRPSPRPRRSE